MASKPLGHLLVLGVLSSVTEDTHEQAVAQLFRKLTSELKKKIGFAHTYSADFTKELGVRGRCCVCCPAVLRRRISIRRGVRPRVF